MVTIASKHTFPRRAFSAKQKNVSMDVKNDSRELEEATDEITFSRASCKEAEGKCLRTFPKNLRTALRRQYRKSWLSQPPGWPTWRKSGRKVEISLTKPTRIKKTLTTNSQRIVTAKAVEKEEQRNSFNSNAMNNVTGQKRKKELNSVPTRLQWSLYR